MFTSELENILCYGISSYKLVKVSFFTEKGIWDEIFWV